jgi:hypothetical protein
MLKIELIGGPFDGTKDHDIGEPVEDSVILQISGPVGRFSKIKSVPYRLDLKNKKAYYHET